MIDNQCFIRCETDWYMSLLTSLSDMPTKMNMRSSSCTSPSCWCSSPSYAISLWATGELPWYISHWQRFFAVSLNPALIPAYRFLDAILNFLLVWYYCTLTIRESILITNGSRSASHATNTLRMQLLLQIKLLALLRGTTFKYDI